MGRRKQITDRELIETARAVFRESGHSASTREIARRAGVTQAVIFQRFKTKDELFFAAMSPQPPDLKALLGSEEEAAADVEVYLEAVARRLFDYFVVGAPSVLHLMTHPAFTAQVLAHAHEHLLAAQLGKKLAARLRRLQSRGLISEVEPRAAAETFIAALHSIAIFHTLAGSRTAMHETALHALVAVFWKGMSPRP